MAGTTPTTVQPPQPFDGTGGPTHHSVIRTWLKEWWAWLDTNGAMSKYQPEWNLFVDSIDSTDLNAFLEDAYLNAGSLQGDELIEAINSAAVDLLADAYIIDGKPTAIEIRSDRANTPAAVIATASSDLPESRSAIGSWLISRGLMYDANEGDPDLPEVMTVDVEVQQKLLDAALIVLNRGGADRPELKWPEAIPILEMMPPHQLDHVLEIAYPGTQTPWVMVEAPTGGMVGAPKTNIDAMRRQLPGLSTADIHGALFASSTYDIDWEPILLAADARGKIEPVQTPDIVDPTTGAVIPGQLTGQTTNLDETAQLIKAGLDEYGGDMAFAILHAVDPELASKVRNNPYALTTSAIDQMQGILKNYQYYSSAEGTPKAPTSLAVMLQLQPSGEVAETRDSNPDVIRESFRNLYKLWFLQDPTDKELDAFSAHFDGELDAYQRSRLDARKNPFDAETALVAGPSTGAGPANLRTSSPPSTATATPGFDVAQPDVGTAGRSYLRADDMYKRLFDHKPGGLTEEDYVQAFTTQAAETLGAAHGSLATGSIRAGMQSGDPRDVGRHALMTGGADRSGTLSEKMSRAGEIFRSLT